MNRNRLVNTMFHFLNLEVIKILQKHLNNKNDNFKNKELYEDWRASNKFIWCMVILMSAFDIRQEELLKVLPSMTIDGLISKPISMKKLAENINHILKADS
jgi:hypothetical protein